MAEVKVLKNKKEQFDYLTAIKKEFESAAGDDGQLSLGKVDEIMAVVLTTFEPKVGGGVSSNPPKEIDGVMNYFCRHFQDYMPEDEMIMSQGKSKGASKYANKYFFKLEKDVQKLKDDALVKLVSGDPELIGEGTQMHAQAAAIEESRTKPETFKTEEFEAFKLEVIAEEQEKEAAKSAVEAK